MDFDIILKFETLKEEQTMMLNFLGLTQTITIIHNIHENSRKLSREQQLFILKWYLQKNGKICIVSMNMILCYLIIAWPTDKEIILIFCTEILTYKKS